MTDLRTTRDPEVEPIAQLIGDGARALVGRVRRLAEGAVRLLAMPRVLRDSARQQVEDLNADRVKARLREQPIVTLRAVVGPGVRLSQLERAGFRTVADLLRASPQALDAVPGVGPTTVTSAIAAARTAALHLHRDTRFRFDPDRPDDAQTRLLATLAALRAADHAVGVLHGPLQRFLDQTMPLVPYAERAGNRLRMFFTGRARRDSALEALDQLRSIMADPRVADLERQLDSCARAVDPAAYAPRELWQRYLSDAAAVNALLTTAVADATHDEDEAAQGFVPEELRQQVTAEPLDTTFLTATLRGYQVFGAQYAIHQQRAILGDEMGLGKTVQALAALAHLATRDQRRFLVVCPASVQINWLNEIGKHTRLKAHSLHGADREAAGQAWLREGGVAVTTFGTLARLPLRVGAAEVAMLVVDEAHFVKNPGTARSRSVAEAVDRAQRVLFLTGTPMENRVEEFRNLVGYLRPEVAARVGAQDGLAGARAFRRAVAPTYLRRNTDDVLSELPEKIEVEDWVQLSEEDEAAYAYAVTAGHLMAMRRAAFVAPTSAKLERLAQLVEEAAEDGMKVVVFSYFLSVLSTVAQRLGDAVIGSITGAVPPAGRQHLVDDFTGRVGHAVLLAQIEAGGVGINMQAASLVIIAEPQWKPSTEDQAIARAHRMGQVRTVQVHRLLAKDSVDERIREVQESKALLFDAYARESDAKDADRRSVDTGLHRPPDLDDAAVPLERRVVLAEQYRLMRNADDLR